MKTKRLYTENVYLSSCDAEILKIDEDKIVLDQTVFFPEGGGQASDKGTINNFDVQDVQEIKNEIIHTVKDHNFKIGDKVCCQINWAHRFDNMQRHCGEHIMSGMWFREYGGVNRGFHMGDNYMTVDISLEEDPKYTEVTWQMAQHIENCTNEAIWQNLPVITRHFNSKKEAENLPLRKALAIEEDITIVCVGDINNPSDCVACCGTHPATSGQVGLLKIYKVEKNKGMFRIYFEAGKRAMVDFDAKHDIITEIGNKYSAGTHDLIKKLDAQEDRYKELKETHAKLRNSIIKLRQDEINTALNGCEDVLLYRYEDMLVDDLLNIGRPLIDKIKKLLLIADDSTNTLLLFSNGTIECGKLVKENASIYNGKGGGNKNNARAIFPSRDMMDTYIDLIEKHLR